MGIKAAVADAEKHAEHQTFAGVSVPAVLYHAGRESVVSICSCMSCSTWSVSVHGRAVEDPVRLCCASVNIAQLVDTRCKPKVRVLS